MGDVTMLSRAPQRQPSFIGTRTVQIQATVVSIDYEARKIVLRGIDNNTASC